MNLALKDITKVYGSQKILDSLSIDFHIGQITAVVGGNGEGKTLLLNIISGNVTPDNGRIFFDTKDVTRFNSNQRAQMGIGRLFQEIRLFPSMSALQNIMVGLTTQTEENPLKGFFFSKAIKTQEASHLIKARALLTQVGLKGNENKTPSMLSYGQCKLLSIAVLLGRQPKVLLLDEPSAGLSDNNVVNLSKLLQTIKSNGTTIIIVEHNKSLVGNICENTMVLKNGRIEVKS